MRSYGLLLVSLLAVTCKIFAQGEVQPFPLSSVQLLESPFKRAQQTDLEYILQLDVDRLLAPFLTEAGLPLKAERYGNWENTGLDGHIGGHYLSALSNMYASTKHPELLRRLNYMVDRLAECQESSGNGYVAGIPGGSAAWKQVANGVINVNGFGLNDKWVPWYNIHKLYAGLVDAYLVGGNAKAKEVLIRLSDWCLDLTRNLSDAQVQQMLISEHGGMNEVFADVASITGDKKYLDLAKRFSHQIILNPLLKQKDSLNGLHANTQIPKVIGFARIAEVSGEQSWRDAADFFWHTVVNNRTVSIGGNSVREHFHPSNNFSSMVEDKEGPETCNTYNMLKLTKHLFLQKPSNELMDYYERALYNHILSSQHPNGGFVYFTSMRPRHYRVYSQAQEGFWCCVGSGLENHGKYGELIYARQDDDLLVNLYIPSQLEWKEKSIRVIQQNNFPYEEQSGLTVLLEKPSNFSIRFRYPKWVKDGALKVFVNGKPVAFKTDTANYAVIKRTWRNGDKIRIVMPMQTKAEQLPDGSSWVSFVHGPIVLAAITDTTDLKGLKADGSRMGHIANGKLYPVEEAPLLLSKPALANELKPVKGKAMNFTAQGIIYPTKYKNLRLVPFYTIHDARYILYWPVADSTSIQKRNEGIHKAEEARLALESKTVDQVAPGEQQPESDHNFTSFNTESGVHRDRHWRHAAGWFSYDLKNDQREGKILRVTYYGGDSNRNFEIHINGRKLKDVSLDGSHGDSFYDVDYIIPDEINSDKMTIRFNAKQGSIAGGIYYVRLLKH